MEVKSRTVRITITFQADGEVDLPIQYNHILQGFIYNNLSDHDYRRFLHEEGYQYEKGSSNSLPFLVWKVVSGWGGDEGESSYSRFAW